MLKKKANVYGLLIFSVLFWAVLSDAWGYSEHFLTELPYGWNVYIYGLISRFLWVLPFLILLVSGKQGQIFKARFHWKSFGLALLLVTIYTLCGMYFAHGGWWTNPDVMLPQLLCKYLMVGFVEELVYRGFGLHLLSQFMGENTANFISSCFFAAVHLPSYGIHWLCDGTFSLSAMLLQTGTAFILGLIFGIIFRKSKSVWAPAIVHFWYDLTFLLFIG